MEIIEVRIKLAERRSDKLQAFATVTFDRCFVVRDLKVISGLKGLFVAMPSRKLTVRCPRCRAKNHLKAKCCNECGTKLPGHKLPVDDRGRPKLYADVAHPINQHCRDHVQRSVIDAFKKELERSKEAGYEPPSDDYFDAGPDDDPDGYEEQHGSPGPVAEKKDQTSDDDTFTPNAPDASEKEGAGGPSSDSGGADDADDGSPDLGILR